MYSEMSFSAFLALKMKQLRDDQVGGHGVDLFTKEDDAVVEQARVDIVAALAAGLLDDVRNERGVDA